MHGASHQKQQNVDIFAGNSFGQKISFTVGSSYFLGALLGAAKGLYLGAPSLFKPMPWRLKFNNVFNLLGKNATAVGNAFGAAGFLYYLVGSSISFIFQDELKDVNNLTKNVAFGGLTGALYKSQRGFRGMVVGGGIGAALLLALTLATQKANQKGLVSFDIRF